MTLYWRLNSIPELQGLSKFQQRQLWRKGHRAALRTPLFWIAHMLLSGVGAIGTLTPVMLDAFPNNILISIGWMLCWLTLGLVIYNPILMRVMRPLLAQHRAALEPHARDADGSYYVPPAF